MYQMRYLLISNNIQKSWLLIQFINLLPQELLNHLSILRCKIWVTVPKSPLSRKIKDLMRKIILMQEISWSLWFTADSMAASILSSSFLQVSLRTKVHTKSWPFALQPSLETVLEWVLETISPHEPKFSTSKQRKQGKCMRCKIWWMRKRSKLLISISLKGSRSMIPIESQI